MRKLTRASLCGAAAMAAAVVSLPAPALAGSGPTTPRVVTARGDLRDLAPASPNATDGAKVTVIAVESQNSTRVILLITGLDPAAAGTTFGAHVHTGPCVAGSPALAGPHYNTGGPPSPSTEIWLDFTVAANGVARSEATVPFGLPPGAANSVVVHALPTAPSGFAGPRIACEPVAF